MKTLKLMIIAPMMAFFILNVSAKSQSTGLYLTVHDYLSHKLSYTTVGNDKLKIGGLFGSSTVVLTRDSKKQVFAKSEIFGYSKDGQDYRFFNNVEYRILSAKGLLIYSRSTLVQQGKGPKPTEQYYFSSGLSDQIQPLTIANIKGVYAKYPKFTYAVESLFKNDGDLAAYDSYNKQYKIAWLYSQNSM
jgi:hypothetical protein